MSRIDSFKKNLLTLKDDDFLNQKRRNTAREARGKRENQFNKNRDIPGMLSNNSIQQRPNKKEEAQKLVEWRKKKHLEKQNKKINKKPFLPSGPGSINKTSLSLETAVQTSRSLHNSLTSSSNSNRNSLTHDLKQLPNSRVTRSQARRDADKTSGSSLTKPTLLVDEQELAWIPDNELGDMNLKVRRKSLRFSDIFSKAHRSPFVFRGNPETALPAVREPTILETSVDVSPISAPTPTVSRNLIGAFSLMGDDTELLMDSESNGNEFETVPSVRKSSKEFATNEASTESEPPQRAGIEMYSHLLQGTTEDLVSQRDRWQGTLNTLTEACDNIRCAIGHTDLLLNKKFPQYSGLIRDATDNPGELDLETRCSDLQGFWDLILREVEGMQAKYSKLIKLAENGYQAVKSTHKLDRKPRRVVPRPKKESTRVTRASSSSLREQIMRGREQMKEQQKQTGDNLVIM